MSDETAIAWTDHTFNPWWGCEKILAPGHDPSECDNCYAETGSVRYGWSDEGASGPALWGHGTERRKLSEANWNAPRKWDRLAAEAGVTDLVFSGSYCDVFEARDDLDGERARLWSLIEETPNLVWQLLTKRPEQVARRVPPAWLDAWPSNVWIGTSVGTQRSAEIRIPRLLSIPAPIRFLSCEPLLGPLDLSRWLLLEWMDALGDPEAPASFRGEGGWGREMLAEAAGDRTGIAWIICGGESGPGHRPLDIDHARDLRDQALAAGVPWFFKQVGGASPHSNGDLLDGERIQEFPAGMGARHEVPVALS